MKKKKFYDYPEKEKISFYGLISIIIIVSLLFFFMIRIFLIPLIIAATFSVLFYPLNKIILKILHNKKTLSALLSCIVLILLFFGPMYVLGHFVALQAIDFYNKAEPYVVSLIESIDKNKGIVENLNQIPLFAWLNLDIENLRTALMDGVKLFGSLATIVINKTSKGIADLFTNLFLVFFILFYFFRDGERLAAKIVYLSPLRPEYEQKIVDKFILTSRATIKGTLLVGLIQGTLGALTLLIFGIKTWLLWGFIMVILSIIPMLGSWLVLVPIGIIQIIMGNMWQGIIIILISLIVVSNIDNLLRPILVGMEAKIHDLLVFFSSIGGISMFGLMGFIIGPIIASLFVTILEIYSIEFKSILINKKE